MFIQNRLPASLQTYFQRQESGFGFQNSLRSKEKGGETKKSKLASWLLGWKRFGYNDESVEFCCGEVSTPWYRSYE